MTIREIIVLENQSLYDLCIQHYGSYDGLLDLIEQNEGIINSVDQVLPAGTILKIGDAVDQDLVDYFINLKVDVVSAVVLPSINSDGVFTSEFTNEFA